MSMNEYWERERESAGLRYFIIKFTKLNIFFAMKSKFIIAFGKGNCAYI